MKLDNITGLPELPEGDWWEVRERMVSRYIGIDLSYVSSQDGYEVAWMTPNISGRKLVYRRKHWFSFFKSHFYVDSDEPLTFAKEPIFEHDVITGSKIAKNITKSLIQSAAYKLVKDIADEALTKSLLGSYPPNKLS